MGVLAAMKRGSNEHFLGKINDEQKKKKKKRIEKNMRCTKNSFAPLHCSPQAMGTSLGGWLY